METCAINSLTSKYIVFVPFVVAIFIQTTKLFIDSFKNKTFFLKNIFTSGGFPSVHSGVSASAATLAFLEVGPDSMIFVVTVVFMFLFVYDAVNIRYEAGKHAHYINNLRIELGEVFNSPKSPYYLKERLGHTPFEVLGGIFFGIILTILLYQLCI